MISKERLEHILEEKHEALIKLPSSDRPLVLRERDYGYMRGQVELLEELINEAKAETSNIPSETTRQPE